MSNHKQNGFVSIIVAAILMVLLSLVTIGFSQLMQREQRQALDRQLSTQAFYAAETAVNDVYENLDSLPEEKTGCDPTAILTGEIEVTQPEVVYSCLQYDKTPVDLVFTDSINTSSSKVFPIQDEANRSVNSVTFRWNGPDGSVAIDSNANSCPSNALPASFDIDAIPMLRVDLISVPIGGFTRDDLINNTANLYLYPKSCGTNTDSFTNFIAPDDTGQVVDVDCSGGSCSFTMDSMSASNRYYARIRSIYNSVETLNITATAFADPNPFEFKDAQTLVDATGRANDVLRRIEVRISNKPDYPWPEYVVRSSDGICKELTYRPGSPDAVVTGVNCY